MNGLVCGTEREGTGKGAMEECCLFYLRSGSSIMGSLGMKGNPRTHVQESGPGAVENSPDGDMRTGATPGGKQV